MLDSTATGTHHSSTEQEINGLPPTPQATISETSPGSNSSHSNGTALSENSVLSHQAQAGMSPNLTLINGIEASKITKACSRCRRLKVRCVRSDPDDPQSPCKRCIKSKRECTIDVSRRRRQHPPSLNSPLNPNSYRSLQENSQASFSTAASTPVSGFAMPSTSTSVSMVARPVGTTGNVSTQTSPGQAFTPTQDSPHGIQYTFSRHSSSTNVNAIREQMMTTWKALTERDAERLAKIEGSPYREITKPANNAIAQGLISREKCEHRLRVYRDKIYPRFPIVPLANAPLDDIINQTPVLFHCVLDVVSLTTRDPALKKTNMLLHNMAYNAVIHEIMITSNKSMELLESLILLTFWYNESEFYHRQRLYSLGALAESLAYDLGIGGTQPPGSSSAPIFEQIVTPHAIIDPNDPQSRLAWLAVYVANFQLISSNRRPVSRLFNSYTLESIKMFSQPEQVIQGANRGAYHLWHMAEIVHLQEQITLQLFKRNNESSAPDLLDPTVQYLMHNFDREIDTLEERITEGTYNRMAFLVLRVYLHQAVLYSPYDNRRGRTPFTNFSIRLKGSLTVQGAKSFANCFTSAMEVLEMVRKFPFEELPIMATPLWGLIVFCCAIVLKCRAVCIFNSAYADAYFVSEESIDVVVSVIERFNRLIDTFPSANSALSYNFLLKLLVCHHDARTHFWASEMGAIRPGELGDPAFVNSVRMAYQQAGRGPPETSQTEQQSYSTGVSPSAVVEAVSPRMMETLVSGTTAGGSSSNQMSGKGFNEQLVARAPSLPNGSEPLPPTPLERELQDRRISIGLSEDYPLWQLSGDFWRDIIPNDGTFNFDF